jgi:RNA polymerase sporulation-specific sigma factor
MYTDSLTSDIITAAKSGDESAVAFIMGFYKKKVSAIAKHYYISGADTDDILQEAMIAVYKAISSYNFSKNDNFDAFLTLCVKRHLSSVVKSSNRKKHLPLNSYVSIDSDDAVLLSVTASDPMATAIDREKISEISHIFNTRLSDYEKRVITLYAEGYTYREIAEKLGKSVKSIDNAVCRIRIKLKSDR